MYKVWCSASPPPSHAENSDSVYTANFLQKLNIFHLNVSLPETILYDIVSSGFWADLEFKVHFKIFATGPPLKKSSAARMIVQLTFTNPQMLVFDRRSWHLQTQVDTDQVHGFWKIQVFGPNSKASTVLLWGFWRMQNEQSGNSVRMLDVGSLGGFATTLATWPDPRTLLLSTCV